MKMTLLAVAALALVPALSINAQVTLTNVAEATIRAGTNANTDIDEATVGYQRVKFVADGSAGNTTACAKSYFKFDFSGQNPNTNADLMLSLTGVANSQTSTMRVWSLDQAYPAFTIVCWSGTPRRPMIPT